MQTEAYFRLFFCSMDAESGGMQGESFVFIVTMWKMIMQVNEFGKNNQTID